MSATPSENATLVFICCADVDLSLATDLRKFAKPLSPKGNLRFWDRGDLLAGQDAQTEVLAQLDSAQLVLALVSADLLASEGDMALLNRAKQNGTTIAPVLVKPCPWEMTWLSELAPLPAPGEFLLSAGVDTAAAWTRVINGVAATLDVQSRHNGRMPFSPTVSAYRSQWLRAVVTAGENRRMLGGISSTALSIGVHDVRVPIRITTGRNEPLALPPLHEQIASAPGTRIVLIGDVGSGKTELMYATAAWFAERALKDPSAPVPILVRARDLEKGLRSALHAMWPVTRDGQSDILDSRMSFYLLVDGLDEAGLDAADHARSIAENLGERCRALVVASRPVPATRKLRANERWLMRWSSMESDRFLDLCVKYAPVPAQRLLRLRSTLPPDLLENPLTATMCLVLAEEDAECFSSRASLFRALVRRLVGDWFSLRKQVPAPGDGRRGKLIEVILNGLQPLALEVVRGQSDAITDARLRRIFEEHFPHEELAVIETTESHLGLLVRREGGRFDFALRSLAEHLAGRALLAEGDDAIVAAAKAPWGAEAVRHAIGLASIDQDRSTDPEKHRASKLLLAILLDEDKDDITYTNRHLRQVLTAIRAASDLPIITKAAQIRLLAAAQRRIWDETSVWVGDRVAEALASWVRTHPKALRDLILLGLGSVIEPVSRASWLAQQQVNDASEEVLRLHERDPSVRWLTTQRLAPFRNEPDVRTWLLASLRDDTTFALPQPVPFGAGSVLRQATRDANFLECLPSLRKLLEHGDAFHQVGAAIALLPGEADAAARARALCRGLGGSGFGVPSEVLREVASDPVGRTELERWAPDWESKSGPRSIEPLPSNWSGLIPSSAEVRERIVRSVAPALREVDSDLLSKVKGAAGLSLPLVACELASDIPEIACALIAAAPEKPLALFWDPDMDKLGRAAVRHKSVRDALVELWARVRSLTESDQRLYRAADYPARALEGLIRRGDDPEAERIFAEWLPCGNHAIPFRTYGAPLLDGFECPTFIRDAGFLVAANYYRQSDKVALGTIAEGLFRLSSFWRHDTEFRHGVESWLSPEDHEKFCLGLWALQSIGLTLEGRRGFRGIVESLAGQPLGPGEEFQWAQSLLILDRWNVLDDIRDVVEALAEFPLCEAVAVPLTFAWHDEGERRARSIKVAANLAWVEFVPQYLADRLVEPAVDVWTERLQKMIVGAASIQHLLPFVRALPLSNQASVIGRWAPSADPYPWVRAGMNPMCFRAADQVREILFDLGLEEPPDEANLATHIQEIETL